MYSIYIFFYALNPCYFKAVDTHAESNSFISFWDFWDLRHEKKIGK